MKAVTGFISMKHKVLALLEEEEDTLSGQEISAQLGISRAAVWKHIESLKREGKNISAVKGKGYRLHAFLTVAKIQRYLEMGNPFSQLQIFTQLPSTNTYLKENPLLPAGTVTIALHQTAGRGRQGRSFYGAPEEGLYFSLRASCENMPAPQLATLAAAVAVCEALEEETGAQPGIKWVNDVFLNGKKIAGLLTEGHFLLEEGRLASLVLGVGLNLSVNQFPQGAGQAGSLFDAVPEVPPARLLAVMLNKLAMWLYAPPEEILPAYRARMFLLGKEILAGGKPARALDIAPDGGLIIERGGQEEHLTAGEVSILPAAANYL